MYAKRRVRSNLNPAKIIINNIAVFQLILKHGENPIRVCNVRSVRLYTEHLEKLECHLKSISQQRLKAVAKV